MIFGFALELNLCVIVGFELDLQKNSIRLITLEGWHATAYFDSLHETLTFAVI